MRILSRQLNPRVPCKAIGGVVRVVARASRDDRNGSRTNGQDESKPRIHRGQKNQRRGRPLSSDRPSQTFAGLTGLRSDPKVRKRTHALAVLSLATLPLEWPPGGHQGNISPHPHFRQMEEPRAAPHASTDGGWRSVRPRKGESRGPLRGPTWLLTKKVALNEPRGCRSDLTETNRSPRTAFCGIGPLRQRHTSSGPRRSPRLWRNVRRQDPPPRKPPVFVRFRPLPPGTGRWRGSAVRGRRFIRRFSASGRLLAADIECPAHDRQVDRSKTDVGIHVDTKGRRPRQFEAKRKR